MIRIVFIILVFSYSSASAVELLVKAQPSWMEGLSDGEKNTLGNEYTSRIVVGDIVAVRPDRWKWGKKEGLPKFIVVKVPGMTMKEASMYEGGIQDITDEAAPIMIKKRKWKLPKNIIDSAQLSNGIITTDKITLENNLVEKTP